MRRDFRITLDGNSLQQITHGKHDLFPQCSADGVSLLYVNNDDRSAPRLMRMSMAGGTPQVIGPGSLYNLSPDGKLVGLVEHGEGLTLAIFSSSDWHMVRRIGLLPGASASVCISPDGRSLFFIVRMSGSAAIWRQPLDGSPPQQWLTTPGKAIRTMKLSPNGTQIGFTALASKADAVTLQEKLGNQLSNCELQLLQRVAQKKPDLRTTAA